MLLIYVGLQTKDADIFDCVDIYKQPAFSHPLLKDHKLQVRTRVNRIIIGSSSYAYLGNWVGLVNISDEP